MKRTVDSYINQMIHTADYYEKKANKLWAMAKNGGSEEGFRYDQARKLYEKVKKYRTNAEQAAKNGRR